MKSGAGGGGPPDKENRLPLLPRCPVPPPVTGLFPLYPELSPRPMCLSGGVQASLSTPLSR